MKKWTAILLTVISIFSLAACSGGETQENSGQESAESAQAAEEEVSPETHEAVPAEEEIVSDPAAEEDTDTNMLVVYFSYAENADLPDGVDASSSASIQVWNDETTGNTGVVAAMIADATGADMFSIETVEKYPDTYDATIDQGQEERNADARPELAAHVENLDSYDVVFLGYPNWWGDMPMAVYCFLDEVDLSGKRLFLLSHPAAADFLIQSAQSKVWNPEQRFRKDCRLVLPVLRPRRTRSQSGLVVWDTSHRWKDFKSMKWVEFLTN